MVSGLFDGAGASGRVQLHQRPELLTWGEHSMAGPRWPFQRRFQTGAHREFIGPRGTTILTALRYADARRGFWQPQEPRSEGRVPLPSRSPLPGGWLAP